LACAKKIPAIKIAGKNLLCCITDANDSPQLSERQEYRCANRTRSPLQLSPSTIQILLGLDADLREHRDFLGTQLIHKFSILSVQ
jgi:hypothetical protein